MCVKDCVKCDVIVLWILCMFWIGMCFEFFVFCVDYCCICCVVELCGYDFFNDNFDGFVNVMVDVVLVL